MFRCHLSGRERDGNEGGDSGAQPQFGTRKKKGGGEGGQRAHAGDRVGVE